MTERFLDKIYDQPTRDAKGVEQVYDQWAASYDAELRAAGYATPSRVARAVAACLHEADAPILDYGAGTGLSGEALQAVGFTTMDGWDLSAEMLSVARAKGLYRDIRQISADPAPEISPGRYRAIIACGVISPGAAPPDLFHLLLAGLNPGGLLAFSLNEHALQDASYTHLVSEAETARTARLLFRQHGPHLPSEGLNADVFVLERL